jgi:hypothetical protein
MSVDVDALAAGAVAGRVTPVGMPARATGRRPNQSRRRVVHGIFSKYPVRPIHDELSFARSGRVSRERRRTERTRAAAATEAAARAALGRLISADAAARSRWQVRQDLTALGVVEEFRFRWVPPRAGDAGHLILLQLCDRCGLSWFTPVRTRAELFAAVIDLRCGCTRRVLASS